MENPQLVSKLLLQNVLFLTELIHKYAIIVSLVTKMTQIKIKLQCFLEHPTNDFRCKTYSQYSLIQYQVPTKCMVLFWQQLKDTINYFIQIFLPSAETQFHSQSPSSYLPKN